MNRKVLIGAILCLAVISVPLLCYKAQSQDNDDNSMLTVPASFYNDVRTKLNTISAQLDKVQGAAVMQKLDQVLANQQTIMQELEVIKIRSTR